MKVYISGPMSNIANWNKPAFQAMADMLRAHGHHPLNPADTRLPSCATWEEYMRADIRLLMDADAIVLLHGWANSRGACLECTIARELGFKIFVEEDFVQVTGAGGETHP